MTVKEFLLKYSKELSEKYFGKYIAIAEDQIAAVSESRTTYIRHWLREKS
jgi:hypothetical protein